MSALSDAAAYWQTVADYWKGVATAQVDAINERDRLIAGLRAQRKKITLELTAEEAAAVARFLLRHQQASTNRRLAANRGSL